MTDYLACGECGAMLGVVMLQNIPTKEIAENGGTIDATIFVQCPNKINLDDGHTLIAYDLRKIAEAVNREARTRDAMARGIADQIEAGVEQRTD